MTTRQHPRRRIQYEGQARKPLRGFTYRDVGKGRKQDAEALSANSPLANTINY